MEILRHQRLAWFWLLSIGFLVTPWACQYAPLRDMLNREMACTVKSVHDGDTMRARCNGKSVKIRLYCIDAPELAQKPWGKESRDHLRSLAPRGSEFTLIRRDTDKYGRIVGEILSNQQNLNTLQILQGHAAVYRKFCAAHSNPDYFNAESSARSEYRGIWSKQGLQQTPWQFRHR